ncbi:hypothetical protein BDA96_05G205400 [Sorghum bicolor]|uniref:Uncharacterized protein n=2 Tax=Sorghum bicolor TaxID=4558 RepID=A0A1B6PTF2_SORBI|nr:hypothetical protein BDA96_05G205400 [Sorghum bicolor]KXG28948.1 hypothetical protein SORBI_3005G188600 [Sorghum bicolor]KXG28949.1 hypothetical protein SORBI_3005G188600 [Sorghum bicolor]
MALGKGRTHIYMGDVDGVSQVEKEGEGIKPSRGRAHVDIGGLVVSSRKPSKRFSGFGLKTIGGQFAGFGLKTTGWMFLDLGLKIWVRF